MGPCINLLSGKLCEDIPPPRKGLGVQRCFKRRGEVRLFHVNSHLQTSREKRSGRKFPYICHKNTTVHHKKVVVAMVKKHLPVWAHFLLIPVYRKNTCVWPHLWKKHMLLKSEPDFFGSMKHLHFPNKKCLISAPFPNPPGAIPWASKARGRSNLNFNISGNFVTWGSQCDPKAEQQTDGWTPAQQLIGRQLPTLPNWNPDFRILINFAFSIHSPKGFFQKHHNSTHSNSTHPNMNPTRRHFKKGTHNANWPVYSTPCNQ